MYLHLRIEPISRKFEFETCLMIGDASLEEELYPNITKYPIQPWSDLGDFPEGVHIYYFDFYFKCSPEIGKELVKKLNSPYGRGHRESPLAFMKEIANLAEDLMKEQEANSQLANSSNPIKIDSVNQDRNPSPSIASAQMSFWKCNVSTTVTIALAEISSTALKPTTP